MPNSDNTFGTYNKQTLIFTQVEDGGRGFVDHADATAAKEYIFTTEALAVWDECCTNIQWELQANNRDLKVTFDFGTKGGDIVLKVCDKKNDTSNSFDIVVGQGATADYTFYFKVENMKMLDGDYDVSVSSKSISHFKHKKLPIEYWIALEPDSTITK